MPVPSTSSAAVVNGVCAGDDDAAALPPRSLNVVVGENVKRTLIMFASDMSARIPVDEESHRAKIACKIRDEYASSRDVYKNREEAAAAAARFLGVGVGEVGGSGRIGAATGATATSAAASAAARGAAASSSSAAAAAAATSKTTTGRIIDSMTTEKKGGRGGTSAAGAGATASGAAAAAAAAPPSSSVVSFSAAPPPAPPAPADPSAPAPAPAPELARRMPARWPRPLWHAPWKCYRVVAGHLGWVRSVAVDRVSNEWLATGSADRTIKIWDLATGKLRLTLTGHIEQVTGLAVSERHPYLFSCSLDKEVKCWDLEANKVVRNYHGHLSGVFCVGLHPALDVLVSGGRDSTARVWDMRSRVQAACLSGHADAVCSLFCQASDPQVVTGSADRTVKLWDIRKTPAKALSTLTYAKKSVRAVVPHPTEYTFAACSADAIKKYKLPGGEFLHNTLQRHPAIVNCCSVNEDGVLATGGDDGSLRFWDWRSGNCFQEARSVAQPGSLEAEAGIFASAFDATGTRFVTAEADKTIKFWKEDERATPENNPVRFVPPQMAHRY